MILKSRAAPEPFIPLLSGIEDLMLQLVQDLTIPRAEALFANTPIGSVSFEAVTYDLAAIEYTSTTKSMLVMALSVVLGGMLGIFVLLIRNAVMRKD